MSCRKKRAKAEGSGGSARNAVNDDSWSLGDEEESDMGEEMSRYKKHQWAVVQAWMNIDIEEAYLRAERDMTDDF